MTKTWIETATACDLSVAPGIWEFAERNVRKIAAHFAREQLTNPTLFNGRVLQLTGHRMQGGKFSGQFIETDFASVLYWRDHGKPDLSAIACSGAAIVQANDGALLFGRSAAHSAHAGIVYPMSGFVDRSDVSLYGRIDADGHVARELMEETGLTSADVTRMPGYLMGFSLATVHFGIVYRSRLPAVELRQQMLEGAAATAEQELDEIVVVRQPADLAVHRATPLAVAYAKFLLA